MWRLRDVVTLVHAYRRSNARRTAWWRRNVIPSWLHDRAWCPYGSVRCPHLQRVRPATAVTGKPRWICSAARKGADPKRKAGADAARVRAGRPIQADASVLWPGGAEQERTRVRSRGVVRLEPAPSSRSNARRCFNPNCY